MHRTCPVCRKAFKPRAAGKPQCYCAKPCYASAALARKRASTTPAGSVSACEGCGCEVTYAGTGRRRRFCNTACKQSAYHRAAPELRKRYNAEFSDRHPGYHARWQQAYRDEDPERARESVRRYYRKHAHNWDKYRVARSKLVRPEDADLTTWQKVAWRFQMWGYRCWICGGEGTERDHVKPLSKGGRHLPANIRPICRSCNSRKGNRWPFTVASMS